ncbi:MAG TPA: DDE transposase family protein [Allocoleopsis sp.]
MEQSKYYIVKRLEGHCEIITSEQLLQEDQEKILQKWGSYDSQSQAFAQRVGLIRAGKCQPI